MGLCVKGLQKSLSIINLSDINRFKRDVNPMATLMLLFPADVVLSFRRKLAILHRFQRRGISRGWNAFYCIPRFENRLTVGNLLQTQLRELTNSYDAPRTDIKLPQTSPAGPRACVYVAGSCSTSMLMEIFIHHNNGSKQ